jgi:hypothetical protein
MNIQELKEKSSEKLITEAEKTTRNLFCHFKKTCRKR